MKQKLIFFAVLMVAMTIPQHVKAYVFSAVAPSGQTLYYNIIENYGAEVTYPGSYHEDHQDNAWIGFTKPVGTLIIPDSVTYNNVTYAVFRIDYKAFSHCTGLTSVTIPNSVRSISQQAFANCSGLLSVTIGRSVITIGSYAFAGCVLLSFVDLLPENAPTLGDFAFSNNSPNIIFRISCGSFSSYCRINKWLSYISYMHEREVEISMEVGTNDSIKGTATIIQQQGGHDVFCDSSTIIYANCNYGYHFDHWSNGSTINPDTLFLSGDSSVVAFFEPNSYTITVESSNETLGIVSGGGTYSYLDTIMIEATVIADHYHFDGWTDYNMENPRQYVVRGDAFLRAYFSIDKFVVSAVPNNTERGAVTGGQQYSYGSVCTLTAGAFSGYQFACWSDGSTSNPYIFAVSEDVELTALFVAEGEQICTVNVVSSDPTKGIVRGGGRAVIGDIVTLKAIAYPGCYFVRWNDNNTDSVRTIEVHGDITYTAFFEGSAGVADVSPDNLRILSKDKQIILEGIEGKRVLIFDIMGRPVYSQTSTLCRISVSVPHTGIYIIKVDDYPSRKIVVIE